MSGYPLLKIRGSSGWGRHRTTGGWTIEEITSKDKQSRYAFVVIDFFRIVQLSSFHVLRLFFTNPCSIESISNILKILLIQRLSIETLSCRILHGDVILIDSNEPFSRKVVTFPSFHHMVNNPSFNN